MDKVAEKSGKVLEFINKATRKKGSAGRPKGGESGYKRPKMDSSSPASLSKQDLNQLMGKKVASVDKEAYVAAAKALLSRAGAAVSKGSKAVQKQWAKGAPIKKAPIKGKGKVKAKVAPTPKVRGVGQAASMAAGRATKKIMSPQMARSTRKATRAVGAHLGRNTKKYIAGGVGAGALMGKNAFLEVLKK